MEIHILRNEFTPKTCIGDLSIDGGPRFCFMLNDRDRGLDSTMSLDELVKRKVKFETAHTTGRFRCVMAWSGNFGCNVPHLLNVPAFDQIELHWGNDAADTHACDLFGTSKALDWVGESRLAYGRFINATFNHIPHSEPVWVTVDRHPVAWANFIAKYPLLKL